jgi:hypothetical protein
MTNTQHPEVESQKLGPPLPGWIFKYIINPTINGILRSPWHGRMSHVLMLLSFRGRKTGKTITTPVGYNREGDAFLVFTDRPWWKNLQDGAKVRMLMQGQWLEGVAEVTTDAMEVAQYIRKDLEQNSAEMAQRRHRLSIRDGRLPSVEEIAAQVRGRALIRIRAGN